MQTQRNAKSLIGLWGLALVFLVSNCTQFDGTDPNKDSTVSQSKISNIDPNARLISLPLSNLLITPVILDGTNEGGNITCDEVALEFGTTFTGEGGGVKRDWNDGFGDGSWPDGFTINVVDGKYVTWSYVPPVGYCLKNLALIVKGSNDANVYYYEADAEGNIVYGDAGLASPINSSGGAAGLSNLTICYSIEPCETVIEEDCESDETAWASRKATYDRYNSQGNWATWIAYTKYSTTNYRLFAGQFYDIGGVTLEPAAGGKVKITINLNEEASEGFSAGGFQATTNNVKIQGYNTPPTGNPSPGQFKTSKGTATGKTYSVIVAFSPYYGIHVDAIRYYICCAIEEPI